MSTATVRVKLGARSYDILIGAGLIAEAGRHIKPFVHSTPVIVVTDQTLARLHLPALARALDAAEIPHVAITMLAGEHTKEFASFQNLMERILDQRPERTSLIVAFGGGVIGDLAGFAASVLLRGVDFVQIPTTLLSQVDSSVGGKTGINTRHGKNLVGAFYQPRLVLADCGVLGTLSRREMLAGYSEVAKYGLIADPGFFAWLETNGAHMVSGDAAALRRGIEVSCAAKAKTVAADEREGGLRELLNFGHTFGHALETETGFSDVLLHGEAVAVGMALAFDLSVRLGLCPQADATRAKHHLTAVGLPTDLAAVPRVGSAESLIAHMQQDKKARRGKLRFVLTRGIGKAFVTADVALDDVAAALDGARAA